MRKLNWKWCHSFSFSNKITKRQWNLHKTYNFFPFLSCKHNLRLNRAVASFSTPFRLSRQLKSNYISLGKPVPEYAFSCTKAFTFLLYDLQLKLYLVVQPGNLSMYGRCFSLMSQTETCRELDNNEKVTCVCFLEWVGKIRKRGGWSMYWCPAVL